MKKRLLVLSLLSLIFSSCSPKPVKDINELNEYTITYLKDSDCNEDSVASEMQETISSNVEYKDIKVQEIEAEINNEYNQIFLKVDKDLDENTYSIKRQKNTFILTSDSNLGLYKAAKDFVNTIKEHDSNNLYDWYLRESKVTYVTNERLKIMTYNVRVSNDNPNGSGEDCSRVMRAPRIIKNVQKYMPDSLGVQELSEDWKTLLNAGLMPQYGYVGYGRNEDLSNEASGIYYNRDTVSLLLSGTKWLSETPSIPGSHFDGAEFNRIFSYGIFERHSDNLRYLHINTHLDLNKSIRKQDVEVINTFLQTYKDKMPIVITGDWNNDKKDDDAIRYLINTYGYVDSFTEDKDAVFEYTYPTEGYYVPGVYEPKHGGIDPQVIDYCMKPNHGLLCEKYYCDTARVSGNGEAPGPTSDHHPVYFEFTPYDTLTPFNELSFSSDNACTDNTFSDYDHEFTFLDTTSNKNNHLTVQAVNSENNGETKSAAKSQTKYQCIGNIGKEGGYIEYHFNSSTNTVADLVMVMSSSLSHLNTSGNCVTENLANFVTLSLNGNNIPLNSVRLRNDEINQWYEWEQVVLRNKNLIEGENILRLESKKYTNDNYYAPNQLLLEIFSNSEVTAI